MRPRRAHAGAYSGSSASARSYRSRASLQRVGVGQQLVAAQIQLVGLGVGRRLPIERMPIGGAQRQRQRRHDVRGQRVLQLKQVGDRRLRDVRPDQRAGVGIGQLRADADMLPGAQDRSGQHDVDAEIAPDRAHVGSRRLTRACAERTMTDSSPASAMETASGTLNARKSVSGSGRSTRSGSATNRVHLALPADRNRL